MSDFYNKLSQQLEKPQEIWVETVLSGKNAGKKRIISGREESKAGSSEERIFRERVGKQPRLIICGAGHVSVPVIQIGRMLGFFVSVLEDRPGFADKARAAGADEVLCLPFGEGLARITGDEDSWFVIVTRGHRYDTECLEAVLNKKYAYVGMMGSRRRTAIVKEQLREKGYAAEVLENVHTPIGLEIHAETPEEIAVSIMAEIIEIRNTEKRTQGYPLPILSELSGERGQSVLAVIISRKGSAPRSVGTKMLIRENGTCVGTIGGGCIESQVIQKALLMMKNGGPDFQVCTIDMTADAAEEEGMVCGGTVEVMLEREKPESRTV